jgi:hypothetical protein
MDNSTKINPEVFFTDEPWLANSYQWQSIEIHILGNA